MATVSQLNHFPFKYLPLTQPRNQTRTSVPVNPSGFGLSLIEGPKLSARELNLMRPVFRLRCTIEDGCSPENGEPVNSGTDGPAVAVAEDPLEEKTEKPEDSAEIEKLKKALVDSLYGTDRGLRATSEMQAQIVELITQLEASNPTPAPTDALALLNGKWILVYTSFSGLFPLLSKGSLPFVKVEEISQTIDSENFTVQNSVQFAGPLATTSVSTNAKFEVRSPKRVQIKFVEGVIGTPQLIDSLEIPENVNFLGQKIDLTPFKGLITSIQDTASSVAKAISSQPPLKFSILNNNAESWLLTTYLDEDLRISRVDAGSVFVLIKEGSLLLTP